MFRVSLCLGVLVAAAAPAFAGDLAATSTIASVTVYPSGATVIRRVPVTLPAGATTILLVDLPAGIDTQSLTVDGSGERALAIASVEARDAPADPEGDPLRVALQADLQFIEDRIDALDDRVDALDGRRRFLEQLIKATPDGFAKALADGKASLADWGTAASTIGDGLAAVADATREARVAERALEKERDEKHKALADLGDPEPHTALAIAVSTDAPTNATLTVRYQVAGARWAPAYDAQLVTGDAGGAPKLTLVRRAEVAQASGEDWDGVTLTLSTTRTTAGTSVPTLSPTLVSFRRPIPATAAREMDLMAPAPMAKLGDAANEAGTVAAAPVEAVADFGSFRAEYRIPGQVSVESGKGARSVQIATETLAPTLEVRAAPVVSEAGYLQAKATMPEGGAPLLAGRVALFRDGVFVGNGNVAFTSSGDMLDLGFGVDDRVKVTRVALDRQLGEHGLILLGSRKTDARRYKITVANLHDQPMDIVVSDTVPYSEDDKIVVERLKEATQPTEVDVDDQRGVLAWRATYAAGESRDIVNAYSVTWPSGEDVTLLD